jgi:putative endonuclease
MYFVYALKSLQRNYTYIGQSADIESRLKRHNSGLERATKPYKPFLLFHVELVSDRLEARLLEIYFKTGFGREIISEIYNEFTSS